MSDHEVQAGNLTHFLQLCDAECITANGNLKFDFTLHKVTYCVLKICTGELRYMSAYEVSVGNLIQISLDYAIQNVLHPTKIWNLILHVFKIQKMLGLLTTASK